MASSPVCAWCGCVYGDFSQTDDVCVCGSSAGNCCAESELAAARVRINELTQRVAALEKCCPSYPNGPQWGHEWSCPKCPD